MFLEKIDVANYRSISNLRLSPCGDFNVLIDKNNSGKSNILTSIEAFFSCLHPAGVNTNPILGGNIDFFQQKLTEPISIQSTFRLSSEERSKLVADISGELPQVRNILDDIAGELSLSIRICVNPLPTRYAFVQCITLLETTSDAGRTLFEIGSQAANELYYANKKMQQAETSKDAIDTFIKRFDEDDYLRTKLAVTNRDARSGLPIQYYFRAMDQSTVAEVTKAFRTTAGEWIRNS
jgi:hypothetical protein